MARPISKLTIVVDALDAPSSEINGQKAWVAVLWPGNKTNGSRPDKTKRIEAHSIIGPLSAIQFVLDIHKHPATAAPEASHAPD